MTTAPRNLQLSTSSSFWTLSYLRVGTLTYDDCAQILRTVNFVQFFHIVPDVNADAIFVGHLFGLLCANPRQRQQRSCPGDPSEESSQAVNFICKT